MIGEVLDDTYRVVERIGAGSMGEVYLVEHVHIDRREAIKVLRPEMAADPRLASRFRREARAINRLRHPNIIGIYDFGQLPDGRLYLTMEYAHGESIDRTLRAKGRFELGRALHILHQLALAIDHAHAQGVSHRDLKPQNLVLVEEHGKVDVLKVLDFGLAKVASRDNEELTLRGELFGTPEYMSPERMAGGPDDPRSDLYSIGCVAYELLTGAPPFVGSRAQVLSQHLQTPPPAPGRKVAGVPGMLDVIVQQLLAKLPRERLQSGAQLAAALEQVPGFPRKKAAWRTGALTTSSQQRAVEVHDEVTPREGGAPRPIGFADTASTQAEELRDEVQGALVELAASVTQQFPGDDGLAIALALVHGVRDDRARILAERAGLDEQQARALQTTREREGSLRFAIAELRFERPRATPEVLVDLDYQIAALDKRVRELTSDLATELRRIDDRGIELAAAEHDLEQQRSMLYKRLRDALAARLRGLGAQASGLADRFYVIDGAIEQLG